MRVAVTGMGGELGTRVALLLEADEQIDAIMGVDLEPPRRHLRRTDYHRVDPRDRERMVEVIVDFAPTVLVHLGVYEPCARSGPRSATTRTAVGTVAALDACLDAGTLEAVVMRSGIEVYGRGPATPVRPDETVAPDPTCPYGESLLHAERVAVDGGAKAGVPVTLLRLAPVVGPHVPSPLGRVLRLPAVPVPVFGSARFCVLHQEDAAAAIVAAVARRPDGPVNVVGRGAVSALEAVRLGGGVPVPTWGPGWRVAAVATEVAGAPLPEHVIELLTRGRLADGDLVEERLGVAPVHTTPEVVAHLHEWAALLAGSSARPAA